MTFVAPLPEDFKRVLKILSEIYWFLLIKCYN
jgi:hypothetical protein